MIISVIMIIISIIMIMIMIIILIVIIRSDSKLSGILDLSGGQNLSFPKNYATQKFMPLKTLCHSKIYATQKILGWHL